MRVLTYAILGFLSRKEMTGYDITTEFKDREIGEFWVAKHSQIYPELKKLTDEELIEYKIEIQGSKLEKKVYSITEKGKKVLEEWLVKNEEELVTPKDEFVLKAYFISSISKEEARVQFENRLKMHMIKLEFLEGKYEELIKIENVTNYESDEFSHYLVLTRAREREKAYVKWLEDSIKLMV